jgi:hypothetical protein
VACFTNCHCTSLEALRQVFELLKSPWVLQGYDEIFRDAEALPTDQASSVVFNTEEYHRPSNSPMVCATGFQELRLAESFGSTDWV